MKVTDKDYYLDNNLVNNIDFCLQRQSKNWDNLFVIDGDEGVGKTTLSWAVAYYISYKLGQSFGNQNIFFDPESMLEFAQANSDKVIVWDEAAVAGLGSEWQSKIQKKLIKNLMMNRKKRHFYIFNVPSFFELRKYLAVRRSIALLHCYSPDNISRGHFTFYGKKRKKNLYLNDKLRKFENYGDSYDFHGKYTNTTHIIDNEAYEKAKDKAIEKVAKDEDKTKKDTELKVLQYKVAHMPYKVKEIAQGIGCSERTIFTWRKHDVEDVLGGRT